MTQKRTRRLLTAGWVLAVVVLSSGEASQAQLTEPINPNADSPVDEVTGDIADVSSDIDTAVQEQFSDLSETVESTTDDLLGGSGDVLGGATGIFDSVSGIQDTLSNFESIFSSIFNLERLFDMLSISLPDIFEDPLGGLAGGGSGGSSGGGSGGSSVQISTGALGLPDPKQVQEQIENAEPTAFEEFAGSKTGGSGSPVVKRDLVTQFERNLTDEIANQTALTEEGQQKLKDNAETAKTALETSKELAEDSVNQDVSQRILQNVSEQLLQQQQTDTLTTIDDQLRARDDALRNKMLVDAVREMQGQRIQDRRETAAAYSAAITQGGQFILPGYGIDLSGGN